MTIYFEILTRTSQNAAKYAAQQHAFAFTLPTCMGHGMKVMNKWYLKEHSGLKPLVFKIFTDRTFSLKTCKLNLKNQNIMIITFAMSPRSEPFLFTINRTSWRCPAAVMTSDRKRKTCAQHLPRRDTLPRKCHEQCYVRDFSKPITARHLCSRASIQSTGEQAPCHFSRWVLMLKAREPCTVYISIMSVETWSPIWNHVHSFLSQ